MFEVTFLDLAVAGMREAAVLAQGRGVAFELARDLEALLRRLRRIPTVWGDPLFNYHHLGMVHLRGRSEFFFVHFSVNLPARRVFVQRVSINPYSRLG